MSDFGFLLENVLGRAMKTILYCFLSPISLLINFRKHIINLLVCIITAIIFLIRLNLRCKANLVDVIVLILFIAFLSRIGQNKGIDYVITPDEEIENN
ncbi:MAG: hypothetical protein ACFFDF_03905 [Candidatus Odinarchaeota archaeon]